MKDNRSTNVAELLKTGDVTRNGKVIGRIEIDGGVFVIMNYLTRKRITVATVEEGLTWLSQK